MQFNRIELYTDVRRTLYSERHLQLEARALSRYHTVNCNLFSFSHPSLLVTMMTHPSHTVHQCSTFRKSCVRTNGCDFLFTWKMLGTAQDLSIDQQNMPESLKRLHQDAHCTASEYYFNDEHQNGEKKIKSFSVAHRMFDVILNVIFDSSFRRLSVCDPYVSLKWF